MPIHTLFRPEGSMRYPRLGIIRLGVTVVSDKMKDGRPVTYPKEVSHFVLPPTLAAAPKIGEKPTKIEVAFPSDEPDRCFDLWYTRYDGPLLAAKCDGVTCTLIPKEGPETRAPCERPERGPSKCPKCGAGALGRLNVIVRHAPVLGVYQVLIGGESRCRSILTELRMYERAGLSRNWFSLERHEEEVQIRTDAGKRLSRTGWPVHILLQYSADQVLGPMAPRAALGAGVPETVVDDDAVPDAPDHDDEPFDITRAFAEAKRLGIDDAMYKDYLYGVYRADTDNLGLDALAAQADKFKAAATSKEAAAEFIRAIETVAGKMREGKVKR